MVHYIPLYFHGIPIRIPKFAVMLTSHVKKHIFSGYISFFFFNHYIILYPHMNRFFLETNVAGAARAAQCGVPQLQRVTEKPGGGVSNREILNVKIWLYYLCCLFFLNPFLSYIYNIYIWFYIYIYDIYMIYIYIWYIWYIYMIYIYDIYGIYICGIYDIYIVSIYHCFMCCSCECMFVLISIELFLDGFVMIRPRLHERIKALKWRSYGGFEWENPRTHWWIFLDLWLLPMEPGLSWVDAVSISVPRGVISNVSDRWHVGVIFDQTFIFGGSALSCWM